MADAITAGIQKPLTTDHPIAASLLADIPLVVGDELMLTGAVDHEVTDVFTEGAKVIARALTAAIADARVSGELYGRRFFSALAGTGNVTRGTACVKELTTGRPIAFKNHIHWRAAKALVDLAGTVTTQGTARVTVGGVNADTVLPVGTDPSEAADMIVDTINRAAVVGALVRATKGIAAAAEGGVGRGSVGLAGVVTTGGDLRATINGTNVDTTLPVGCTPFEAAEMVADAINLDATVNPLVLAFATSADADAIAGAKAFGSVVIDTNATGGAVAVTITLAGIAVPIVPGAGMFPDAAAAALADALNDTAALTDRFHFTWDAEVTGTGGLAAVRIWANNPGAMYNVTLVAASTDATMTAVASGANLTGGADITVATVHIVALQPGSAHNYTLVSTAQAPLAGIVPTASGAALVGGTDIAAATVFLEVCYVGVEGNLVALAASAEGGLVGLVPTASGALFTGGVSGHRPENIWCWALSTATAGSIADFVEL